MHIEQKIKDLNEENSEYWDEKQFYINKRDETWKLMTPQLYTVFWYINI